MKNKSFPHLPINNQVYSQIQHQIKKMTFLKESQFHEVEEAKLQRTCQNIQLCSQVVPKNKAEVEMDKKVHENKVLVKIM